jgi:hypothetical protein
MSKDGSIHPKELNSQPNSSLSLSRVADADAVADAGGLEVQMTPRRKKPALDPAVCGERLAQVLALADALPKRPAAAQGDKAQYKIEP